MAKGIEGPQTTASYHTEVKDKAQEKQLGKTSDSRTVRQKDNQKKIPQDSSNQNSIKQKTALTSRAVSLIEPRDRAESSVSADSGYGSDNYDDDDFSDNESLFSDHSLNDTKKNRPDSLIEPISRTESSVSINSGRSNDDEFSDKTSLSSHRLPSNTEKFGSMDSIDSGVYDVSENSDIGAAGHSDTFVKVGDGYIGKLTSESEADIYNRRTELHLDSILPENKSIEKLNENEMRALSSLSKRAEMSNMSVIVPEMLGKNIPDNQKLEMDIKIGYKTASYEQLKETQHESSLNKTVKHKIMDSAYGSTSRGYRLEGLKIQGKKPETSRLKLTRNSKKHIKSVIKKAGSDNKKIILTDLKAIRNNLAISKATFVASSALFLIDKEEPVNTVVKLIDVAHPVEFSNKNFKSIKRDNNRALNNLIDYIEGIKTK